MKRTVSTLMMLLAALIWGCAFVAQSAAMDSIGPWTFTCIRSVLASIVLVPVAKAADVLRRKHEPDYKSDRSSTIRGGIACGIVLAAASMFQQVGILYTTVSKAGFLTALYCVLVPIMNRFMGKKSKGTIWISAALACIGLYLLCMNGSSFSLQHGDVLEIICAVLFAVHILVIDHYTRTADGIRMSCIQFLVCAVICLPGMIIERPDWHSLRAAAVPILYAGILSSAGGYTLQIIGQKNADPTVAGILLCLESVFATLAGWIILHQSLSPREIAGCVLMFCAIVLASLSENQTSSDSQS